jgi:hypothetical protein
MAFFQSVRVYRARRLIASGSPVLFAGGVALAGLAVSSISKGLSLDHVAVWVLLVLWIALLLFQMSAEYQKRTYDPTWLLKFIDIFDSEAMQCTRCKASRFLKENRAKLADKECVSFDVNDLLDFFENLGFVMQGDQITAEAAHHAFHYWIRGYYSAARMYLKTAREQEPSSWEFVEFLFDMADQIERERYENRLKDVTLLGEKETEEFLDEEIASTCGLGVDSTRTSAIGIERT